MAKLNDLIVTGDAKFLGKLHANADTATTASSVFDAGDNSILTLNRSATALSNPTYLAGWDGNVLKAVNRSNLSVNYANSSGAISALTENDKASSSDVQRRVWFAYSNNTTGRPAYDDAFTYQTSTGTLTAKIFKGALSGTSDRSKYLETWKADKSQGTYGTQYPLYAWWESNNVCKLVVDSYSTKVDTANTAAALTSNAGSVGQAIYFANGVPVALDWRMGNKDVGEHNCNNVTYNFSGYYTSNGPSTDLGASTSDGALWSQAYNSTWVAQIAQDYRNGNLFVRGKNNGTWQGWKAVLTNENFASVLDGRYVNTSGDTMSGTLNMDNHSITGIGDLSFADPGANEGITWTGGNGWWIYESPDNLTNDKGNLQFVQGTTRRLTMRTDGVIDIPSGVMTPYINMTPYSVGDGKAKNWYRIWTGVQSNAGGHSYCVFTISRSYNSPQNESYTFAVTVGYNGDINITQLSGVQGSPQIPKIRVVYKNSGKVYIDFYGNANENYENNYYVSGFGYGKFQTPTVTSTTVESGYTAYEFTTMGGMKTSGFLSVGGSTSSSYALATPSFICDSWVRTKNNSGWYNETYDGGIYMIDTTYVRTYNDKSFYVSNTEQHAIYTAGGFASAKTNGPVLSTYYNNTWYGDTIQTHGNGNLSISAPGGNLYLAYARGVTYFGGGTYCIDRSGYFNGTSAAAYYLPTSITFADSSSPWTPATIYSSIGSGGRIKKGTWDYAGNGYVANGNTTNGSKCPFFAIDLAGTTVIQAANSSSVYTQIYITAPTSSGVTGAATNEMVFYNYHGDDYSPAWTRVLTNRNYSSYALPLSGGTMSGSIAYSHENSSKRILYGTLRNSGMKYDYGGNEALIISSGTYGSSSIHFYTANRLSMTDSSGQWNNTTPCLSIKNTCVGINAVPDTNYNLYVNGSSYFSGSATITGILTLTRTTDAATTADSGPALIVGGTRTTAHIEIDTNEVLAKSDGTTETDLYLGTLTAKVHIGQDTKGSTTKPIYLSSGVVTECSTYAGGTAVTLNGTSKAGSTASFYAPLTAGTSGYILKSNGSGAPTWLQTLPVANGGTGITSWTINRPIYASGATTLTYASSIYISNSVIRPTSSGGATLGASSQPWDYVYANYIGSSSKKVTTVYATTVAASDITTTGTHIFTFNGNNRIKLDSNSARMYFYTTANDGTAGIEIWGTYGNITAIGTITANSFNATSDKRLKTNFRPFAHGDILSLPLYKFDFISSQRKDAIGCLAQDLQQICPEIVHEDKNGYLSIEESKIVYLLIDKMKEMQKEIDTLKEVK